MRYLILPASILLSACSVAQTDIAIDQDQDGLMSNIEADLGTDPALPDSDQDGVNDGKEYEQGTDPLDPADKPYIGEWSIDKQCRDGISGVGNAVGDITTDVLGIDQFGEEVSMYDFCARAILITSGAFW
jgi:hypothetical protein